MYWSQEVNKSVTNVTTCPVSLLYFKNVHVEQKGEKSRKYNNLSIVRSNISGHNDNRHNNNINKNTDNNKSSDSYNHS